MNRPSFEELGRRQSLLGPRFVGFMRWLGGAAVAGAGTAAVGTTLAAVEARFPVTRRYEVSVPARPGLQPLTILHISDLHMFPGQGFIRDYLAQVAGEEQFDLVVSTGDNLGAREGMPLLLEALEPLLSYPGAFVLGSNDYYSPEYKAWHTYFFHEELQRRANTKSADAPDLPWLETVEAMTEAGWVDLTNQTGQLTLALAGGAQHVSLIGVDDPHIKRDRIPQPGPDWGQASSWRFALAHSPYRRVLDAFSADEADLIMAGHTHGGQIRVPGLGAIVTNTDIAREYSRGLFDWPNPNGVGNTKLHVSAGLGTSRYAPIRLFCRPEVSLIRVCPAD